MAKFKDAAELIKKGYFLNDIAEELKISFSTLKDYLFRAAGYGFILRSDIIFAIDVNMRNYIESVINDLETDYWYDIYKESKKDNFSIDKDELRFYLELRDTRISLGDMYEYIYTIETNLHKVIKNILIKQYGTGDKGWWEKGIPLTIRKKCAERREEDLECESYCYTDLIDLSNILFFKNKKLKMNNWNIIKEKLPVIANYEKNKLETNLIRLNYIRKAVMHPVRDIRISDNDFKFVFDFRNSLHLDEWEINKISVNY